MKELKVVEFFGGIGACSKAFERLNIPHKVVDYVEIDESAVKSYNAVHGTNFEPQDITKWDKDIEIDFLMHGSPCFVAGTKILTNMGYKNIEDIVIGDNVLTHTNNFNEVIDFGSDGKKPIYKVDATGILPIYCTDNHPFYVRHRNKVWNNKLRKYEYSFSEPEKVRLYNLTKNDNYIGVPIIPDKETEFSYMSDETLWLLGRYVADGWYRNSPRKDRPSNHKCTYFAVGTKKIQDFEKHIKTYEYSICDITTGCRKYKFGVGFTNIVINSGFNKGALNKNIPLGILQLPKHKLKVFLDGYMSGDGYNPKNSSTYVATTVSRELAESLVLAIQKVYNVGCEIHFLKRPKKHNIEGRLVNQNGVYTIKFNLTPKKSSYLVDKTCIWYPIKKISNTNTIQTIYNMTVKDDHTYTANNCYVGNCQDFSVAGKQAGGDANSGTRSSLMYETIRIVEKLRPKYVVWENVKNLLSERHNHNYTKYLKIMSSFGYTNYQDVLNSMDYGIPQHRERIFTVSILNNDKIYYFPNKQVLKNKVDKLLESDVPESYYLSDDKVESLLNIEAYIENGVQYKGKQVELPCIGASRGRDENNPNNRIPGSNLVQTFEINTNGVANTLTSFQKDNYVIEKVPNLKTQLCNRLVAEHIVKGGEIINHSYTTSEQRPNLEDYIESDNGIVPTLTTRPDILGYAEKKNDKIRIRKLTPKECWRLMGFDDEDFEKASQVNSSMQLYKQARKFHCC